MKFHECYDGLRNSFYVDLTDNFCCDFDLFGITTGWGPSQLKIATNSTNPHTSVSMYGKPVIIMWRKSI